MRESPESPESTTASDDREPTQRSFDARLEVSTALARYEMLARLATKHALDDGKPDGSKWARIAIRATEAKSTLLQDIGMLDRQIGTLFVDDGKPVERTPTGPELQERFAEIEVTEVEIVSDAERAYLHGDAAAAAAAAAAKEAI